MNASVPERKVIAEEVFGQIERVTFDNGGNAGGDSKMKMIFGFSGVKPSQNWR